MNLSEITALLSGADDEWLFAEAGRVRRLVFGRDVYMRGIVEFSNHCINSCLYCGLRRSNSRVQRYRMDPPEILRAADLAGRLGMGSVVLQSGDDFYYAGPSIARVIREIKRSQDVAITLSLGDRTEDDLRLWKACGADRYLLKIETFNQKYFERLRPGCRITDRFRRIEVLRNLGYEVGSGVITGLPGATPDLMASDIIRLTALNLDMIAVGPFVPHPDTPLATEPAGDTMHALRCLAILRITNPYANMPAVSALASVNRDARAQALQCGANVLMPSLTPEDVRRHYSIYPGKNSDPLITAERITLCKKMIEAAGYFPSAAKGFSPRRYHGQNTARNETGHYDPGTQERR